MNCRRVVGFANIYSSAFVYNIRAHATKISVWLNYCRLFFLELNWRDISCWSFVFFYDSYNTNKVNGMDYTPFGSHSPLIDFFKYNSITTILSFDWSFSRERRSKHRRITDKTWTLPLAITLNGCDWPFIRTLSTILVRSTHRFQSIEKRWSVRVTSSLRRANHTCFTSRSTQIRKRLVKWSLSLDTPHHWAYHTSERQSEHSAQFIEWVYRNRRDASRVISRAVCHFLGYAWRFAWQKCIHVVISARLFGGFFVCVEE